MTLSPDCRVLAGSTWEGAVAFWDVGSGNLQSMLESEEHPWSLLAFSPNGQILADGRVTDPGVSASSRSDHMVILWDMSTRQALARHEFELLPGEGLMGLVFSPDSRSLAVAGGERKAWVWDVASSEVKIDLGSHLTTRGKYIHFYSVAFSPDRQTLATGDWDGTVHLWDLASGQLQASLKLGGAQVRSLVFSPDGRTLAAGDGDGTVRLADVRTGQVLATLGAHVGKVLSVAFSPDGQTLATSGEDAAVRLWKLER